MSTFFISRKDHQINVEGRNLIDLVFSWTIRDVLNRNLYKDRVKNIPNTFISTTDYLDSFVGPLVEETHAELLSCMTKVATSPSRELRSVSRDYSDDGPPKELFYNIVLKDSDSATYVPQAGDLVALTDVRPKGISDLVPYRLAYVQGLDKDIPAKLLILSSKNLEEQSCVDLSQQKSTLFIVFLTSMTTNIRMWKALHPDPRGWNLKMIYKVIEMNGDDEENCDMCLSERNPGIVPSFESSGLNDSQKDAIISCIETSCCHHQNTVKLIWGPPGTGKTKVVGLLLFALLRMKCRTISCAPTNIAAIEVASRLVSLVPGTCAYRTYGFGDIVLFGNEERMRIDDHDDLRDVFLDHRVDMLFKCFNPLSGWKTNLVSMINLLEDPEGRYYRYLANRASEKSNEKQKKEEESTKHRMEGENAQEAEACKDAPMTLAEFVKKRFDVFHDRLRFFAVNLYTHLPTHVISLEMVKNMMTALDMMRSLGKRIEDADLVKFIAMKGRCLSTLKTLPQLFAVPDFKDKFMMKCFCLDNACLLFCTASGSSKLNTERRQPLDLLVIDEAAQLKECESAIPFQLWGLRHAVLIGDERQLPAMIQSKISAEAGFGRSMFERLVLLGQKKQLLNIQYRMHPAISSFPNKEFYDGKILDDPIVKDRSHEKHFLQGSMYGPYSFINVACGKEQVDRVYSLKNMGEVAVVCKIISKLFEEFRITKQRIRIGVISPYKSQVHAIQEKLEKKYSCYEDMGFNVSIRPIDGFQGLEEDVIIFSTVRCNANGSVGFLSSHQRTNVALTRARHCLWILGNEATLVKRGTVWKKIVVDAKRRDCFFNADDDKDLSQAIVTALVELEEFDTLFSMDSPLFKEARWKICLSNDFRKSVANIKNTESYQQMFDLLVKLSSGWRESHRQNNMLQVYPVNGYLSLLWSVDIIKENSEFIQVLKVWDVLPVLDIPKVAKNLEMILLQKYTVNKMRACKYQCVEGKLVVPKRWALGESPFASPESLSGSIASLSLEDGSSSSYSNFRAQNRGWRIAKEAFGLKSNSRCGI